MVAVIDPADFIEAFQKILHSTIISLPDIALSFDKDRCASCFCCIFYCDCATACNINITPNSMPLCNENFHLLQHTNFHVAEIVLNQQYLHLRPLHRPL